jgi:hypothetical protein
MGTVAVSIMKYARVPYINFSWFSCKLREIVLLYIISEKGYSFKK